MSDYCKHGVLKELNCCRCNDEKETQQGKITQEQAEEWISKYYEKKREYDDKEHAFMFYDTGRYLNLIQEEQKEIYKTPKKVVDYIKKKQKQKKYICIKKDNYEGIGDHFIIKILRAKSKKEIMTKYPSVYNVVSIKKLKKNEQII